MFRMDIIYITQSVFLNVLITHLKILLVEFVKIVHSLVRNALIILIVKFVNHSIIYSRIDAFLNALSVILQTIIQTVKNVVKIVKLVKA